ncbi:MAG: tRNA lysidine(34) synthetase TilS [Acidobacteria bacterium]|nr:tRNA lysidine(34) synthetase TilS [Acidobacteriota bacterium]MYE43069.1 tRNA lysidine(34) synthetase TilS [Acidobacteriota bacterium]
MAPRAPDSGVPEASTPEKQGPGRPVLTAVREALAAALDWFPDDAGNRSVLIGFSGGMDSTALLHLLGGPGGVRERAGGPALLAAHLDHRLRPDSGEQARFARTVASSLGVECVSGRQDVGNRAHREGRSIEEAGRLARLDFFAEVARERGAATVLLGHTLTDQAETVLLQLARGAGTLGLGAMAPVRNDERGVVIVRPLLSVSRTEIARLVTESEWPFYPDPSNELQQFTRNRIRRQLLPLFHDAVNPQAEAALGRTASLLRDDEEWLSEITSARFREVASVVERAGSRLVRFRAVALGTAHPALARRLVREGLRIARGDLRRIGAVHIEAVLRLVRAGRGGSSVNLPGAVARLEQRVLTVAATEDASGGSAGES